MGGVKVHAIFHTKVFLQVLHWILYFTRSAGLLCCILENVLGISQSRAGREPLITHWKRVLEYFLPEMSWRIEILKLTDYLQPQARKRVFLVGCRKSFFPDGVPSPLKPFGARSLKECLGAYENASRSDFCLQHQQNIKDYEHLIKSMASQGKIEPEDVVVISTDRAKNAVYAMPVTVNLCPTLTASNGYLMVLSVADVLDGTPDKDRKYFRKVHPCERFAMQGLPPSLFRHLPKGIALIKKTAGDI
jgi:site-specific DNA-cytosine methylase